MELFKDHKNIFIGIGIVIILFIGYSFVKPDSNAKKEVQVVSSQAGGQTPAASREIVALLADLKSIKIKRDFFSEPAFRSLYDFSTPVPDEPRGRTNPFAPVGSDAVPTGTPTKGAGQ